MFVSWRGAPQVLPFESIFLLPILLPIKKPVHVTGFLIGGDTGIQTPDLGAASAAL